MKSNLPNTWHIIGASEVLASITIVVVAIVAKSSWWWSRVHTGSRTAWVLPLVDWTPGDSMKMAVPEGALHFSFPTELPSGQQSKKVPMQWTLVS